MFAIKSKLISLCAILIALFVLTLAILPSTTVFAADKVTKDDWTATPKAYETKNDCNGTTIQANTTGDSHCAILDYIVLFIRILSGVVGVVVVAMIILGGIQYSASGDDPQAVAKAKSRIMSALLAVVVYIFGFALLQYLVPGGIL